MKLQNIVFISALMLPVVVSASDKPERPPELAVDLRDPAIIDATRAYLYRNRMINLSGRGVFSVLATTVTGLVSYACIPDDTLSYQKPAIAIVALGAGLLARKIVRDRPYEKNARQAFEDAKKFKETNRLTDEEYNTLMNDTVRNSAVAEKVKRDHPWLSCLCN